MQSAAGERSMRSVLWSGSSIVMLAVCLCGGVATADDPASLGDKIGAALSAVHSYQVDITWPVYDRSGSLVVVHGVGSRYHETTHLGDTTDFIMLGATLYQRTRTGWHKFILNPNDFATLSKPPALRRNAEPLPDRLEDGVTVGAMQTAATVVLPDLDPVSNTRGPGVCTYDKGTFLLRACTFDEATLHYSHYDDPSLTIEVPAKAKSAPAIELPSMLPQPTAPPV
jgi:hypothetical protein